jgi:hypothetical protein
VQRSTGTNKYKEEDVMIKNNLLFMPATLIMAVSVHMEGKLRIPYAPLMKYFLKSVYTRYWGTSPDITLTQGEKNRHNMSQWHRAPSYPQDVVRHLMRVSAVKDNTHTRSHTTGILTGTVGFSLAYYFGGAITSNTTAARLGACALGAYALGYYISSCIYNHAKRRILEGQMCDLIKSTPPQLLTKDEFNTRQPIAFSNLGALVVNYYVMNHCDSEALAKLLFQWQKIGSAMAS